MSHVLPEQASPRPGGVTPAATDLHGLVSRIGGAFMTSPYARAIAERLGLDGWSTYLVGRGGVLGDVDADVVSAAMAFFPTEFVRRHWETARSVVPPAAGAVTYRDAVAGWGREHLDGLEEAARLAELLARVAEAASPVGASLFAGWRAQLPPEDPPARAAHLAHVLREHRGGMHVVAVLAAGMSPLAAILSGPRGEPNARFFGWPGPYPPVTEADRRTRAEIELLTDRLVAPAWSVLDATEQAEVARLLATVTARPDAPPVRRATGEAPLNTDA
ncbi:MAG: SCO6745 family protein [Actinomycetes bacterium]